MEVIKLMVVALAGWINQQQEDVIEKGDRSDLANRATWRAITRAWRARSSSLTVDLRKQGRGAAWRIASLLLLQGWGLNQVLENNGDRLEAYLADAR